MTPTPSRSLVAAALLASFLLLPGCGDSEPAPAPSETAAIPPKPTETPPAPEPEPEPPSTKVDMSVRLKAGDVHRFLSTTTIDQLQNVMGMEIETQIDSNQEWSIEVVTVDEQGTAACKLRFGRAWGKMSSNMMGDFEFDSDGDDEDGLTGNPMIDGQLKMVRGMFTALADATLDATIDSTGRISDVKGMDEVLLDGPRAGGGGLALSPARMIEQFSDLLSVGSAEPVDVDAIWVVRDELPSASGRALKVQRTNTLASATDDVALIETVGKFDLSAFEKAAGEEEPEEEEPLDMSDPSSMQRVMKERMMEAAKKAKVTAASARGTSHVSRTDGLPNLVTNEFSTTVEMPNVMQPGGDPMVTEMTVAQQLQRVGPDGKPVHVEPEVQAEEPTKGEKGEDKAEDEGSKGGNGK